VLGTLLGPNRGGYPYAYAFQRDASGAHTLALAGWPTDLVDLQAPTNASLQFGFITRSAVKASGSLFVLSPRGDLIATVDDADNATRIRVLHIDGRPAIELRLPAGVKGGWPWSWAPDEAAIVATGCRPCNRAQTPVGPQTATHSHLYIVPIDGSPWRELLNEDNTAQVPSWSPTSETIAVTHWPCPTGSFLPRCGPGDSSLSLLTVGDGSDHPVATSTTIAEWPSWSADGARVAFVGGTAAGEEMRGGAIYVADADGSHVTRVVDTTERRAPIWSPDGRWLLFQNSDSQDWWLVPADGGEPRDLGPFGGMAW
jgi:Tol biopolymer transport system component